MMTMGASFLPCVSMRLPLWEQGWQVCNMLSLLMLEEWIGRYQQGRETCASVGRGDGATPPWPLSV